MATTARRSLYPKPVMKIETLAIHAGHKIEAGTRDVTPAIHLSTVFERAEDGSFPGGHIYSRQSNPNRAALEECLASLEGGTAAVAFSSGIAATAGLLQALSPGDHVIAATDVFYGTSTLLKSLLARWGLQATLVDMSDPAAVERAVTPATRMLWVETPSNPLLNITDLRAMAAIARARGLLLACDNTEPTPLFQRPLGLGAHVVMHSVTKYLSGHSDVLGGALVFGPCDGLEGDWVEKVRAVQHGHGGVPSPFECWLAMRGIQTFPYRVRAQAQSAQRIAEHLAGHPALEAVHYPGLATHPGHAIAKAQMSGFGGMLSIQVQGGKSRALKLVAGVRLFVRATSFGGVHSTIEHRVSVETPGSRTPENLLRISIGLEHVDDLIEDLDRALKAL